jgi:hypothetical protein
LPLQLEFIQGDHWVPLSFGSEPAFIYETKVYVKALG